MPGFSRTLAISFALKGFTVLLQTARTEHFGPVISQWQASKYLAIQEGRKRTRMANRRRNMPLSLNLIVSVIFQIFRRNSGVIAHPGTLIPLLFQCEDPGSRRQATATIKVSQRLVW